MKKVFSKLNLFSRQEDGQGLAEYSVVAGVLVVAVVAGATLFGDTFTNAFGVESSVAEESEFDFDNPDYTPGPGNSGGGDGGTTPDPEVPDNPDPGNPDPDPDPGNPAPEIPENEDDFTYEMNHANGYWTVTGCINNCDVETLYVPTDRNGIKIGAIGNGAFQSSNLTNTTIVLPSSIDRIEDNAFRSASFKGISMKDNDTLTYIGDRSFFSATVETFNLFTLHTNSLMINTSAFQNLSTTSGSMDFDAFTTVESNVFGGNFFNTYHGDIHLRSIGIMDDKNLFAGKTLNGSLTLGGDGPYLFEPGNQGVAGITVHGNLTIGKSITRINDWSNDFFTGITVDGTLTIQAQIYSVIQHTFANAKVGTLVFDTNTKVNFLHASFSNLDIDTFVFNTGQSTYSNGPFMNTPVKSFALPNNISSGKELFTGTNFIFPNWFYTQGTEFMYIPRYDDSTYSGNISLFGNQSATDINATQAGVQYITDDAEVCNAAKTVFGTENSTEYYYLQNLQIEKFNYDFDNVEATLGGQGNGDYTLTQC